MVCFSREKVQQKQFVQFSSLIRKELFRTIIYYPLSLGRNFDELYRVIIALQTADEFAIATPADWRPGDDVIVPTAGSCGVAKDRMNGKEKNVTCHDWFFCTKPISKDEIMKKSTEEKVKNISSHIKGHNNFIVAFLFCIKCDYFSN